MRIRASRELLVQVTNARFCAGVVIVDEHVEEAAPVLRHTEGWHRKRLVEYYRAHGASVEVVW